MHAKLTIDLFVEKARLKHGNKYDYSLVQYINNDIKVKIICPIHGVFEQSPHDHLKGHACPNCDYRKKLTIDLFIEKARLIHGNKYDYSLVQYTNNRAKINIICPKHGIFVQVAKSHLSGAGCPKCSVLYSKGEEKIEKYLKRYNIKFISQHKFNNCKGEKHKLPFDFYLPNHNICIEFDGKQHYEPLHGLPQFNKRLIRDKIKTKYCIDNNIKLIRIPYWEKSNIESIILSIMINPEVKNIPDPQQII
jgi:hypothetical protein